MIIKSQTPKIILLMLFLVLAQSKSINPKCVDLKKGQLVNECGAEIDKIKHLSYVVHGGCVIEPGTKVMTDEGLKMFENENANGFGSNFVQFAKTKRGLKGKMKTKLFGGCFTKVKDEDVFTLYQINRFRGQMTVPKIDDYKNMFKQQGVPDRCPEALSLIPVEAYPSIMMGMLTVDNGIFGNQNDEMLVVLNKTLNLVDITIPEHSNYRNIASFIEKLDDKLFTKLINQLTLSTTYNDYRADRKQAAIAGVGDVLEAFTNDQVSFFYRNIVDMAARVTDKDFKRRFIESSIIQMSFMGPKMFPYLFGVNSFGGIITHEALSRRILNDCIPVRGWVSSFKELFMNSREKIKTLAQVLGDLSKIELSKPKSPVTAPQDDDDDETVGGILNVPTLHSGTKQGLDKPANPTKVDDILDWL